MPDVYAVRFTEGEFAVLAVVAIEHHYSGSCKMSARDLALQAGVSEGTAYGALSLAHYLRLIDKWMRSEEPLILIRSAKWKRWLKRPDIEQTLVDTVNYLAGSAQAEGR